MTRPKGSIRNDLLTCSMLVLASPAFVRPARRPTLGRVARRSQPRSQIGRQPQQIGEHSPGSDRRSGARALHDERVTGVVVHSLPDPWGGGGRRPRAAQNGSVVGRGRACKVK